MANKKLLFLIKYFENHDLGHYLIELLMLDLDIVKLLRFNITNDDKDRLLKILNELKNNSNFKFIFEDEFVYILKDSYELESTKLRDANYLGEKLGFPKCCIKNHLEATNRDRQIANIKIEEENNWLLNNFFHESVYHLIPHWPCSFNCKESIRMAENFYNQLENILPELHNKIKNKLSGSFWHIYAVSDEIKAKTKFSNDIVLKLEGEQTTLTIFKNPIFDYEELYNANDEICEFLKKLNNLEEIEIIDEEKIKINKNEINLSEHFKQLTQFINFQ